MGVPTNAIYNGMIVRTRTASGKRTLAAVTDGLSNTLCVSEKRLMTTRYRDGDWHDDCGYMDGWDPDIMRLTGMQPMQDGPTGVSGYEFGSAHSGRMSALMGDGSVRSISYSINLTTFDRLGHASDGQTLGDF